MFMSEPEGSRRLRPRANTTSFTSFPWRRTRQEQEPLPPGLPSQLTHPNLSLQELLNTVVPPAVPSLVHARALAAILSSVSPLPSRDLLNPILLSLCDPDSPASLQAAGHDILSAYFDNHEALSLGITERFSYLSLFLGATPAWGMELWEPRFKALRSLTKYGVDIIGIETTLINVLKSWIQGAFDGLLKPPISIVRSERIERERSIDVLVKFLSDVLQRTETMSRITEEIMSDVLQFYASLVHRSIASPYAKSALSIASESLNTSPQIKLGHRRNLSSLSSSSTPSLASSPPPAQDTPTLKQPAELAIGLYLNNLSLHIKTLSPVCLNSILPILFISLSFSSAFLPQMTIKEQTRKKGTLEDKITETLNGLFGGPYAATCMLVLRQYLFPPGYTPEKRPSVAPLLNSFVDNLESPEYTGSPMALLISRGAHRTLRIYVRRALSARLARAYISRETPTSYSHSRAPGHMDLEVDLMAKAWPKDDYSAGSGSSGWEAGSLGRALAQSVGAWVDCNLKVTTVPKPESQQMSALKNEQQGKDEILEEITGLLKDILQELDLRLEENGTIDEEEAEVVSLALFKLSGYILPLKGPDGAPFIIPLKQPSSAPTPLLRTIASFLARDHMGFLNPRLTSILIYVAEHLTDADTSLLPLLMLERHDLSPTSPEWLKNWESILGNETLINLQRSLTRKSIMDALRVVYNTVKDMASYRRPLGDLVHKFCRSTDGRGDQGDDADVMWKILGEEVVLRIVEQEPENVDGETELSSFLDLLFAVASSKDSKLDSEEVETPDTASIHTVETQSPTTSRIQSDNNLSSREKEKDSTLPSMRSLLSSLATGGTSSRSQSIQPLQADDTKRNFESPLTSSLREASAVSALVEIFCQLTFTPFALEQKNLKFAIHIYEMLLNIISKGRSARAKLTALQFLMRLRADRDHRLYFVSAGYDHNGLIYSLGSLINKVGEPESVTGMSKVPDDIVLDNPDVQRARPRFPQERDGREFSRGRGSGGPSHSGPSRSRSRTTAPPITPTPKPLESLWHLPESLTFYVAGADSPSEVLVSYDPEGPDRIVVLPISHYLQTVISLLQRETSWEVLSYVICHLPVQLSNKHLFCGPKCRLEISRILSVLCSGIRGGDFATSVEQWPTNLKVRDAQGLASHTLSVLLSYQRCFEPPQRHLLVEVFQAGLNGQLSTIKCCLHALSLAAFELPSSMTKYLSRILEKLSQIMSNPSMAVHILGFLSIIGSLPALYANFTEGDFKMVFGVALQYLQHYNSLNVSETMSWALSQHVRILSYSVVYIWFLAVKLPDRPHHVRYITRQLLLANEGKAQVDGPTEVCFDWLSRYTYASADPRPAGSIFSDIVLNPTASNSEAREKTWSLGNSFVTVRTLTRSGWVEIMSRRPSGFSRFVCRVENVPMVGPGDVVPDLLSIPASLIMERDPSRLLTEADGSSIIVNKVREISNKWIDINMLNVHIQDVVHDFPEDSEQEKKPDPITGYVWSGTAPSQRRKEVDIDPAFLMLQLSPFPDGSTEPPVKKVPSSVMLTKFVNSLDRIPVIDTHKVGIMYVAPGQSDEVDILRNTFGSPAYTRFLEGIGRLINLRGQVDVYAGGLDPDEDGEYAYAWWDDIGQILYHTATMMPSHAHDPQSNNKKSHIGNDYVRIVWNDSGMPYRFDTLKTQFQFVNIVIEPHSSGSIAAFSNNLHEHEYFKVTVQSAPGMTEFTPIGHFKLISAENLPLLARQLSLLADWFASFFAGTQHDTVRVEMKTNWHSRLETIRRFKNQLPVDETTTDVIDGVMGQEALRDFTTSF